MKTIRIAALDIANRHPLGLKCQTDSTYARFATELAELLAKQNIQGFEGRNVKELAIVLTMYYEDVLSDLGMWYSFTERMHQLYGRYLPFFDVDEKQYYRDEPNNVDIRFLIWLFISRTEPGYIVAPDTLAVEYASEVVGELMDRKFEEMPVNEELKEYFAHPAFENVFTMQRDAQKWFFFTNYLTCNEHAMDITMQQGMRFSRNMNCPPQLALRVSECVAVYENKLQPLALRPNEWLGMLLDYNGAKEEAARVKEQEYLPFDFYKIVEAAGFEIRQPGCSACLAMNDDKIPAGKYSVSTSNRNFEGRQGPGSRTILASPLVAAAAAVTGVITDPRELM